REHLELQALGERLIGLSAPELATMERDPVLLEALADAQAIRSHGALRRQRQLIGKLMRRADAEHIRAALETLGSGERAATAVFHAAERWRERLCDGRQEALADFARETGLATEALAGLLHELERAPDETTRRRIRRRLFREIHAMLRENANENGAGE